MARSNNSIGALGADPLTVALHVAAVDDLPWSDQQALDDATRGWIAWSNALDEAQRLFGEASDVMFICHQWPVWGRERIGELLGMHRDLYRYIHDETLRLANHGHGPTEISELIELPETLNGFWANRGCYGALSHNAKAVYQRYLGWFDGNPANLEPLTAADAGRRYVDLMGGADAVVEQARSSHVAGEDRWAAELLKHVLAASPDHAPAGALQADVFEQLGYRAESGAWRNFYLVGALELRHGFPAGRTFANPDLVAGMTTRNVLDYLAIRLNGPRAATERLAVGLEISGSDPGIIEERCLLIVGNGVFRSTPPPYERPACTLRISRRALAELAFGAITVDALINNGDASIAGDQAGLDALLSLLDTFDSDFSLVTPNPR